jgi:hypothetical protein
MNGVVISTIDQMIEKAEQEAAKPNSWGYGIYSEGNFQVYLVPAEQRTRRMRSHYRATYLKNEAGDWKRTNRADFERKHGEGK